MYVISESLMSFYLSYIVLLLSIRGTDRVLYEAVVEDPCTSVVKELDAELSYTRIVYEITI
jgi:hypothetical protein